MPLISDAGHRCSFAPERGLLGSIAYGRSLLIDDAPALVLDFADSLNRTSGIDWSNSLRRSSWIFVTSESWQKEVANAESDAIGNRQPLNTSVSSSCARRLEQDISETCGE